MSDCQRIISRDSLLLINYCTILGEFKNQNLKIMMIGNAEKIVRYISILALTVGLFGLSACETVKGTAKDVKLVGQNIGAVATGGEVPPYDENGNPQFTVGAMPKGYNYSDNPADFDKLDYAVKNNDTELYDPNTGDRAGGMRNNDLTMPSYSGGILTSDNSVTIYPISQQMQNTFQGQAPNYSGSRYMPMSQGYDDMPSVMNYGGGNGNEIYFSHGSSRLGSVDLQKISNVAQNKNGVITVEGYASRPTQSGQGTVQASVLNLKESMNRSFAVSSALLKKGVPAENVKTVSYGSGKATGNPDHDRRVDIIAGY